MAAIPSIRFNADGCGIIGAMPHLGKAFYQRIILIMLLAGMLSACGSNLWGMYDPLLTSTPNVFWTLSPTWSTSASTETPLSESTTPILLTEIAIPTATASTIKPPITYYSQSGDSLSVVAEHFSVEISEIISSSSLPQTGLLNPDMPLIIPNKLGETTPSEQIIPDSEIVYSPSSAGFDIEKYVNEKAGYLSTYRDWVSGGWLTGAQAVQRSALDNSINPRLLLALIEYESKWVQSQPTNIAETDYPLGYLDFYYRGLFRQMMWAVQELSMGYYGWRGGTLKELTFPDGTTMRIAPDLNAGTVALQYFFAQKYNYVEWLHVIDARAGFVALYTEMFGDPWKLAVEIFPPGTVQPALTLPFEKGRVWSFSQGPHGAWLENDAQAALDFAPASAESGCANSEFWILAPAPGKVVRSEVGVVILDLDRDGSEQSGWNLLFLHVATNGRVAQGTVMNAGDRIGHPSCEGGIFTGTHLHFARKYNGEWILADSPLPFVLSGWVTHATGEQHQGTLTKDDQVVIGKTGGTFETNIVRTSDE